MCSTDLSCFGFQEIETYNTRLFKEEKDGHVTYILRLASVVATGKFTLSYFLIKTKKYVLWKIYPYFMLQVIIGSLSTDIQEP